MACLAVVAAAVLWPRLPRVASRGLADADQYELLSLDPMRSEVLDPRDFHRHKVLGRTVVTDAAVRRRLADALRDGVEPFYTSRPMCFNPRLGIRAIRGAETTDFLVCFGCKRALVWHGEQVETDWTTNRRPQAAFDQVLQAAGVPLAADDD